MLPDVVIPVRHGEFNQSLRYTLRSIDKHVPHRRVWIAGHMPSWVRNVGHVPTRQTNTKYENSRANWKAAVDNPDMVDDFIIFNDDFFVMKPVRLPLPVLHRGFLADVEAHFRTRVKPGRYMLGMRQTMGLLAQLGIEDPVCYEMHTPMLLNRKKYLEIWKIGNRIKYPHSRTLYGNYWKLGGEKATDPKILTTAPVFPKQATYLSTLPSAFNRGEVGRFIRNSFPNPCRYEASGRSATARTIVPRRGPQRAPARRRLR